MASENSYETIIPEQLNFEGKDSFQVISSARKFVILVPDWGEQGEPLVYPEHTEKAGASFYSRKGTPVEGKGIVFFNYKDKAWQAVCGNGKGVIIINDVDSIQGEKLSEKLSLLRATADDLTLSALKSVLQYAVEVLGLTDMYHSSVEFVESQMEPVSGYTQKSNHPYGLMQRKATDVCDAIFIPGAFVFEGPAATAQVFEDGGVILRQHGRYRGVQPDIFLRTYKYSDGRTIILPQ